MKSLIGCLVLVSFSFAGLAQQDPLYSQYAFNLLAINPAYSGMRNQADFALNSRFQWAGVEGSPTTNILTANTSLMKEKGGFGIIFSSDKIGIDRTTEAHISYGYKVQWNDLTVSFGLQTGFVNFNYKVDNLTLRVFDDPLFSSTERRVTKLNFGAGFFVKSDKFLFGAAIPKALNNNFSEADSDPLNPVFLRKQG